jgi:hypothetical protein
MADAPKKKGALAALLSFGGKSSDPPEESDGSRYSRGSDLPDDEEGDDDMDAEGAAFDAFASASGIPEPKRASAREALARFIKACGGYDDTEEEETETEKE